MSTNQPSFVKLLPPSFFIYFFLPFIQVPLHTYTLGHCIITGLPQMWSFKFELNADRLPFHLFVSFFSWRRQTPLKEQRHWLWTWIPLPHKKNTHSLSLSPHHSLSFCNHPYPHPAQRFPPSSYVCKRSHGNCRTACLATGFILSLENKGGNRMGGWGVVGIAVFIWMHGCGWGR